MPARLWLVAGLAVVACACFEAFLPAERLAGPRVLAIRSEPVELPSDGSVTLQALLYLPDGGTATQHWSWCPQLGGAATNYACAVSAQTLATALVPDGGLSIDYDAGTGDTLTFGWPIDRALIETLCISNGQRSSNAGTSDAGDDAGSDGGTDAGGDGGTASSVRLDCTNGLSLTILLEAEVGSTKLSAERALVANFSEPSSLNTNPTTGELFIVDGGATLRAGASYTLRLEVPSSASDSYSQNVVVFNPPASDGGDDGGFQPPEMRRRTLLEGLSIAWYVEAGTLGAATTSVGVGELDDAGVDPRDLELLRSNTWTLGASTRGPVKVIAVLRDTREGVSWLERTFTVEAP